MKSTKKKVEATLVKDDERTFHIKDDPSLGHQTIPMISPIGRNQNGKNSLNSVVKLWCKKNFNL